MSESERREPRRVFIVGCRRSGTTWTMLLLAQHLEVVAVQQADFFRRLDHFGRWFKTKDEFGMCLLTARLGNGEAIPADAETGLARLPVDQALSRAAYYDFIRPLARDVYDRFAACNPGARVVVEQTPEYVQCWEEILRVFPDAWFLHVIRDPRSVFSSFRSAARTWADALRFSDDPATVAAEWVREVESGRRIAAATDRYLEIGYEDLRRDSAAHLARLFDWLGLSADPVFCAKAVETCSLDRMRRSEGVAPRGFFRKGEVSGWRAELTRGQIRTIEHVAGGLMRDLGYDLVHRHPVPPPLRLRARRFLRRRIDAGRRWAWQDEGRLRRAASRALKAFPGLRKFVLQRVRRPVEGR
ncbi:MAG: sulfotransferase [Planctomycetota bacterium]